MVKLIGLLSGIATARNLNQFSSAPKPVRSCGSSMNMTQCAGSPICIWNANLEGDKCVLDNDVENSPKRLADLMEKLIKSTGVDQFQEQIEDEGLEDKADEDEKTGRMRSTMRSSGIFNQQHFNNPFVQQQRQQSNSWLNNMFNVPQQNSFGFNQNFGNQNNIFMGQVQNMQNLLAKNPVCPVNVPLCKREACQIENPSLDMNAFACGQIKGCCFDMNLFLYKQMFGFDQMYQNTPICHRAVKSDVYEWYTNQIAGPVWMPQFSESVIGKLQAFDQKNPKQWGVLEGCPYNKETMAPLALQIIQRFRATSMGGMNGGMANMGGINPAMMGVNPMLGLAMGSIGSMSSANPIMTNNPVSPMANNAMNPMMMLAMQSSGGSDAKSFLQAAMMGQMAGNNPMLTLMTLKDNEATMDIIMEIIVALSSSYGWDGISRFECQMYGGCWLAEESNVQKGKCLKAFSMDDWQNEAEFTQAVSTVLMYRQSEDGNNAQNDNTGTSSSDNSNSNSGNSGGSLDSLFRSSGTKRNGMFGNMGGFNGMSSNNIGFNNMGTLGTSNGFNGMNNMNNMQGFNNINGFNGMNSMNNMNGMNGMNPMNNMQNMLLMNQLNSGTTPELGDVGTIFSNQIRAQQMQQVQAYADQNQPAMCTTVPAHDRDAAQREHTGNMMRDMAMCQAKGGCFDALMWDYVDQENKKLAEEQAQQNSQRNNLFSSNSNPFGSSNPFRRGRRSVNQGQRSSQLQINPFAAGTINGNTEICNWNNPMDGAVGLNSLQDVITPCCKKVWCYSAETTNIWSTWSAWSECSASCGNAVRERFRSCNSETGEIVEDSQCKGKSRDVEVCQTMACPRMLEWSQWTQCSSSCGIGSQTRSRKCTVPGKCENEMPYEEKICQNTGCFSDWSEWSDCDSVCGGGRMTRERVCLETDKSLCSGETFQNKLCNTGYCEYWGEFQPVGECQNSRGCGAGVQTFSRLCVGGQPGAPGCQGSDKKQGTCMLKDCPSWSQWTSFTGCENNQRQRSRTCVNGQAGVDCAGAGFEVKPCWGYSDNNWSSWGQWGSCTGNRQYRQRTCPQFGACYGSASENRFCNTNVNSNNNNGWSFGNFANSFFGRK